tara:strand:+ start:162767 stop:164236 length:1470 start_codon:yes stop_codon:yes gene_type:complete
MMLFYKNITSIPYIIALGLSSAILSLSPVAPASAESLHEAVEATLGNHPRHEIAVLQIEQAEESRKEQRGAFFPTLRGGATVGRVYGDNSTSRGLSVTRGSGYSWLGEGNIALTQNLFNGLGTVNKNRAADGREAAARYSKDDVREMLASETVLAYMDVMRTEESLSFLGKQKAALDKYEPQFSVLVEQGAVDSTDQTQAHDALADLQSVQSEIESQNHSALARYRMMTGRAPVGKLVKPNLMLDMPADVDMAIGWALENHPQILAASESAHAAWHDSLVERSAFLPKIDSELSYYKKEQDDIIGGEATDARAVVKLNWALSTGGVEAAKFRKSRKVYQESLAQRKDNELTIINNIRESWITKDKIAQQHGITTRRLNLARALMNTRREQFEGGKVSLLQLMQAHSQYYALGLEKLQLDYAQHNGDYMVLSAMGALYSRLTPQVALAVVAPELKESEPEIEDFCEHQQEHGHKGKSGKQAGSELCPESE